MRSLAILIAGLLPLLGLAQSGDFHIQGSHSKGNSTGKIFLSYREGNKMVLDSTTIQQGEFQFSGTISGPVQASIVYDKAVLWQRSATAPKEQLSFYIGQGSTRIKVSDQLKDAQVSGNKIAEDFVVYSRYMAPADQGLEAVNIKFYSSSPEQQTDTVYVNKLKIERDTYFSKKTELQRAYIQANPDSYFSAVALRDFTLFTFDVAQVEPMFLGLSQAVRASNTGQAIAQRIMETKQTSIGQLAPDFEQKDPDGKVIKLSDFRGKYVLLDFWASWCGPCRAENPNVKTAYNTFKDKKFDVLNVSLDHDRAQWLKAIENDGLTWTQVSDLKGWDNVAARRYYISGVPQNFLIDPSGKIIAVNLKGQSLQDKLAELLQ